MVLNNAFVFHLGFKFEDKMHKSKNNENKLVSIHSKSSDSSFRMFSGGEISFLEFWNFQKCIQTRYETKVSKK